jgi:hypothetical protein
VGVPVPAAKPPRKDTDPQPAVVESTSGNPSFPGKRESRAISEALAVSARLRGHDEKVGGSYVYFCNELLRRAGRRLSLFPERLKRLRRVDVDENGVVVHLHLGDEFGVFADQMLGADIAGEPGHFGKKPL